MRVLIGAIFSILLTAYFFYDFGKQSVIAEHDLLTKEYCWGWELKEHYQDFVVVYQDTFYRNPCPLLKASKVVASELNNLDSTDVKELKLLLKAFEKLN